MAEFLVIDAELSWDGTFELLYSYTTSREPHRSPPGEGDDEPLTALVIDAEGNQIASSRLRRFEAPEQDPLSPVWDIHGVISLPRPASGVRIVTADGEHVAEFELGDEPELRIDVETAKDQSTAHLRASYEPRPPGSWMAVQLLSDSQGPRTVHLGAPRESLEVDLVDVWASELRIGVLFSTGTRAASAISEPLSIGPGDLPLVVSAPPAHTVVSNWDYIDCVAALRFPIRSAPELLSSVRWTVDGVEAGQGRLITVGPLAPGKHEIRATVDGHDDASGGSDSVVLTVRESGPGESRQSD